MHFDLSKPQALLRQSVREFCKREFSAQRVRELAGSECVIDDRQWSEFSAQGWIGMHLPEDMGGLGLGFVELAVVMEELGRACVPGPLLATNWALSLMAAADSENTRGEIARVIEGASRTAVAVFEEQSAWSNCVSELETRIDDRLVLSGIKKMVLHADQVEALICTAVHHDQLCLVRLPTRQPGVVLVATPGIDSTRKLYECRMEQVPLQRDQILARGAVAAAALTHAQQVGAVMACAEMLGLMQWMLTATVEYAKSRKQFDRVIGSYQAVQHKCADMLLLAESARSATWYAAWSLQERQPDAAQAVSIAKIYVSDAVRKVGNHAVQCHGGVGFTWDHDLHFYYKRAKADETLFGDASFHRELLAELIFS